MTTLNDVKVTLLNYLVENWTDTEIAFDNTNDKLANGNKPWIRAAIRTTYGGQNSLGSFGNRIFRRQGYFIIQVFTPAGTGTETSDRLCQKLLDLFETVDLPGVVLRNGSPRYIVSEGKWYQANVQFSLTYDELK